MLHVGQGTIEVTLAPNATQCSFLEVRREPGNLSLEVVLTHGEKQRGVHQADVDWQVPEPH